MTGPPLTGKTLRLERLETPLGEVLVGASEDELHLLEFSDRAELPAQIERMRRYGRAAVEPGETRITRETAAQLDAYFQGRLREFDLPLALRGTEFQVEVWRELLTIPFGETRSYGEQARRIGRPGAVRAVGKTNGDNRIAIVVPCHRVVGAAGKLTGYGGGLWRKQRLLELEGISGFGETGVLPFD